MTKNNRSNIKLKIIVIVGPTASGKSDLAIKLAKKFKGEIISADSRQVYCGMDIGTGKVKRDQYKGHLCNVTKMPFVSGGMRHYLIDIANPKKQFTASDFKRLGEKALSDIASRTKVPIIVGGTGFYIDILLGRMAVAQVPPNIKLRKHLDKLSAEHLFKLLRKLDPQRAETIDCHNKRRLVRALEIKMSHGLKAVGFKPEIYSLKPVVYNVLWLGINPGKEKLAKNIKTRLDKRLGQGMIEEVQKLHKEKVGWKRLDAFGLEYRWISRWLIKNLKLKIKNYNSKFKSSEEYIYLLRDIVRYSKRQMTWFKRNQDIKWITNKETAERFVQQFLYS